MLVRRPLTKSVELVLSLFQSEINNPSSTLISLFAGEVLIPFSEGNFLNQ
jgi:hypothetical protein